MAERNLKMAIANPLMKLILRSPWHSIASKEIMLLTVTGHKTGKRYTIPVNYVEIDESLSVISQRRRTWWKNLRNGASVTVRLRGKTQSGIAEVHEDVQTVAEGFYRHLQAVPHYAEALDVGLDEEEQPIRADAEKAAEGKVMLQIRLDSVQ